MFGRWRPRPVQLIAITLLLLTSVLAVGYWQHLRIEQEEAIDGSLADLGIASRRAAVAATLHTDSVLRSADTALLQLREDYLRRNRRTDQDLRRILASTLNGVTRSVAVFNARGYAAFTSDTIRKGSFHGDQEYFQAHVTRKSDKVFVTRAMAGSDPQQPQILLTRGIYRNGRFLGVMAIQLRMKDVVQALLDLRLEDDDVASVIRPDGTLVASTRSPERILSMHTPTDRPFLVAAPGTQGTFRGKSMFTGRDTSFGWNRMSAWPLSVVVGLDEETRLARLVQANHTARLRAEWALSALGLMALGIALLLVSLDRRNRELRDGDRRFRQIFDSNVSIKLIIDPENGCIVDANQAAAEFYGWDRETLLSMSIQDINCLTTEEVSREMAKATAQQRPYFTFSHRIASGEIRQVEVYSGPLDTAEGPRVYAIIHDVTERYIALQHLKDNEAFNKAILNGAAYSIICTDLDGVVTLFNQGAENLLGYRAGEVIGQTTLVNFHDISEMLIYADDLARILGRQVDIGLDVLFAKARELEIPDQREWTYLHKDGHRTPVLLSITKLTDADGNHTGYVSIGQDITARRAAEAGLRASEQRLNLVLEGAGLGLWDWDITNDYTTYNDRWAEMLGYRKEEIAPDRPTWRRMIHPEDLPLVENALNAHLRGETPQYTSIHRILHKDEHWVWVLDAGRVTERSPAGIPLRATGIHLDMTTSKNAEDAVKASEAHLRALIEAMDDLVFVVDTSGRLEEIHWPTPPEGIAWPDTASWPGQEYDKYFPAPVAQRMADAIEKLITDGQPHHGEFTWPVGDRERHFLATFSALMNNRGWPEGFLCVARDVTELKELERQLRIQALSDPLTGVGNRRQFYDQINQELARVRRFKSASSILMLDLDHFKNVNDRHGHSAGDQVLQQFSELIQSRLRATDAVGRVGGEEFAILLPETDLPGAREFADALRKLVADSTFNANGIDIPITVSIGISSLAETDTTSDEAIARADAALYRAKANGRNRVEEEPA